MNLDKFSRRNRSAGDNPADGQQYDFTQIAQNAVSDMRAQQADFDSDSQADEFAPRQDKPVRAPLFARRSSDDDAGEQKRKPFAFGKRQQSQKEADPWDQPVSRNEVLGDETGNKPAAGKRKPFGFARRQQPQSAGTVEPAAADDMWVQPDGNETEEPRKPAGFNRHGNQRADNTSFADRTEPPRQMRSPIADLIPDDDFDDFDGFDDFDDDIPSVSTQPAEKKIPPAPPAKPVDNQTGRRMFNAATQPNYSYMTDDGHEEDIAAPAEEQQTESVFRTFRTTVASKFGRNKPGVQYYTPPADRAPSDVRRRQKRRNRRPWPMWLKMAVFGAGLLASFLLILYLAFYVLITGRINYVGDSTQNPVYLSVEEYANLGTDLTETEENAAEFTEPISIAEPSKDVKVIMVVSSDTRIGDVYDSNGRKKTNDSAKTDAIMLIALDNQNRRIRIASIMTDTYVRIQDYKTNKLSKAFYYDTANGDYTLPCLRNAVKDNFGVVPDNYMVVDFNALQILVNRLGGIDIEVSADEAYYMSNHERYGDFPRFNSAGTYRMSGTEALNYARIRAVGNDDYDRVARQRYMFKQILAKIQEMSSLELAELAYAMLPELPTDMSAKQIFGYLTDASDLASYEVTEVTFPITRSWRYGTASVRSEDELQADNKPLGGGDVASSSDILVVNPNAPDPRSTKFTVIVTNFQFNATVLQKYLYENDESYLNGTAANGISVPEIIAPLESDSPAAALNPAAPTAG